MSPYVVGVRYCMRIEGHPRMFFATVVEVHAFELVLADVKTDLGGIFHAARWIIGRATVREAVVGTDVPWPEPKG